ncbi:LacI family DNA-binding transcriptional regulator [Sporosarcina jiandibaonis]|uniref:LacI family DNA-binding transcriptional regulator n=1 Tax=Sporosarcina jiandibaonis TaxID=2715535 RepID=UPI0015518ECC|nr:LacI family DNA-binding transcriptional regulator [Sporosarcina jiandibaonis]
MITMRDVAKKAGVSVATVSRVLNNKSVKLKTVEHVEKVMKELNYHPNQIARSLSKKNTKTIALIIPSINNPFFPELASAIENIAHAFGYKVFLFNTDSSKEKLTNYIDSLGSSFVDGVIMDSHMLEEEDLDKLTQMEIPIVKIDRSNFKDEFTSISVNNKLGGQVATKHLLDVGCKRIGHLKGTDEEITAIHRLWGYRSVLKEFDWFDQSWIAPGNYSVEGGYLGMKELLIRKPEIDGVFAANDLSAIGAMKAIYEWNRKVPDEIAIVGFDGISMARYMVPSLTTIEQPISKMGELAMKELIQLIENPGKKIESFELDIRLRLQESTLR